MIVTIGELDFKSWQFFGMVPRLKKDILKTHDLVNSRILLQKIFEPIVVKRRDATSLTESISDIPPPSKQPRYIYLLRKLLECFHLQSL